jgi:hypothetical protein
MNGIGDRVGGALLTFGTLAHMLSGKHNMRIQVLASPLAAFLVGLGGMLGSRAFEQWAFAHGISVTGATELAAYVGFFFTPFLLCVIGANFKRWDTGYDRFSPAAKADERGMWLRWGMYFVGIFAGYVLT